MFVIKLTCYSQHATSKLCLPRCTSGISAVFQGIYSLNPIGWNKRIS